MHEGAPAGDFKSVVSSLQPAVIIAPHLDDAALSVGAAILAGNLGENPHIVVVFSISNYTLETPGTGDVEVVTRTRRNEEKTACRLMKASVEFLDYGEPLVRGACSDFSDLFNKDFDPTTDPLYHQLIDQIKKIRDRLRPNLMIFPLSLGNHLDHILLNSIGLRLLADSDTRIMFFEDLPYAGIVEPADILEAGSSRGLKPYPVPGVELEQKLLLLQIYKSQLDEFDFELVRRYHDMRTSEHLWGL
jgi:LmbE family N-acetylglucosaminyl deacetylase